MSKKFGKFLLFSAVAGAAAYGAYQYLSKKNKTTVLSGNDEDEDYDDFSEDLDDDSASSKERSYVSLNLDKAEAFASEALQKAKEVITDSVQKVKETVMDSAADRTIIDVTDQSAPASDDADEAAGDTAKEEPAPDTDSSAQPDSAEDADTAAEADTAVADDASEGEAADNAVSGTTASPITEEFPLE